MSEHDHFIRTICESPQDDSLRLIYADWLEERGECGRAEFIRVQCELAVTQRNLTFPAEAPERWADRRKAAKIYDENPRWSALRRRERELLEPGCLRHLPGPFWIRGAEYGWSVGEGAERVSFACVARRGFVEQVSLRLADWLGAVCPECEGTGELGSTGDHDQYIIECRRCQPPGVGYPTRGTGRTNGHGPALVLAAPLTSVRATDREPLLTNGRYYWTSWSDGLPESELPTEISPYSFNVFLTRQEALDWLSRRLVRWARNAAGLPELEVTHAV